MSAETYFNGMLAKERRLTNLGLSAYPSDQEVFEFTLQLAEKVTEARWNTNYIDKLLGQLVKKGMVQVSGLLQNGRYQSRQFVPCYTKDEFLANMLEEQGVNQALFARIAVALFKKPAKSNESEQEEKLIAELEKMVDQYEAALQNKEEK